jgi:glycerophosphoryl diester phosphodiesterase
MPFIGWLLISLGALLAVLFIAFIILTKPAKRGEGLEEFTKYRYAHRGLHSEGVPENSLAAFAAAVKGGYAIELDVRLSKDGVLVVFHDDTLTRMSGIDAKVCEYTAEELSKIPLLETEECVPTFDEVLTLVDGRVPLLVEIKEDGGDDKVSIAAANRLKTYTGPFVVESFNPLSVGRAKKILKDKYCGLLCHNYTKYEAYGKMLYRLLEHFLLNVTCRPDFIAYNHNHAAHRGFKLMKNFYHTVNFAWTVKSAEEEKRARENGFDTVIFEQYIPEE